LEEYWLEILSIEEKNKIKETISIIPTKDHSSAESCKIFTVNIEKNGDAIPTEK
jgi:hypothetical protein